MPSKVYSAAVVGVEAFEVEIEVHAGWGNADKRYRRARHRKSGTRHPDSPTLCFSQNNPDLLCHHSSKLALRLRGQMNTVNALGGDEFAGI